MAFPSIDRVLSVLQALEQKNTIKEIQITLQVLLQTLPTAIDEICEHQKLPEMKCFSYKIKLCASQISKILPLLVEVLATGKDPALKEISKYLIEKLRWCLMETLRILSGGGVEEDHEPSGLFVQSMDEIIHILKYQPQSNVDVKALIDDLLCHALTIAKMAQEEDYKEIAAACQNVLATFREVCPNGMECPETEMNREMLQGALITLERKVNVTVLKMYLGVMSQFLPPLKRIVQKSGLHSSVPLPRMAADIDVDIETLDQYFEKVQLIGNYAVACTECKLNKLRVRCSLASIEYLADYIIPSAVSFYIKPENLIRKRFLQFLTDESLKELKHLENYLDNIVDTPAFVHVLYDDLLELVNRIKKHKKENSFNKADSIDFIAKCYKLVKHVSVTDDPVVRKSQAVKDINKELLSAVRDYECHIRIDKFCTDSLYLEHFNKRIDNVVEHVDQLSVTIDNICLSVLKTNTSKEGENHSTQFAVTSTPFVKSPDDSDITCGNIRLETPSRKEQFSLEPYLSKIRETPLVRSTLYKKTPNKTFSGVPRQLELDISDDFDDGELSSSSSDDDISFPGFNKDSSSKIKFYDYNKSTTNTSFNTELLEQNSLARITDIKLVEKKIKDLNCS